MLSAQASFLNSPFAPSEKLYPLNLVGTVSPSTVTHAMAVLLLLAVAAGTATVLLPTEDPAAVVEMTNTLKFIPDTLKVSTGETVEWRNTSLMVHTVTADPEEATLDESVRLPSGAAPFDSGDMDAGDVFRHTFTKPGTYRYFCIPHEGAKMWGTVIVQP